uniref:Pre-mRNA cleavage complex 2 protein Pcf11 n=1 Tax=Anopheles epiroticus TaxID=199890 RepID=A0A182PRR4_9DIPT
MTDQTATAESRAKQIEKEYLSSLADLNVNSKPLINMLTILAEENLEYAQIIVHAVEKHLAKVAPDVKLPILYLVDSIVKNVGKQYQMLFSQVIVNMFCGVFQTVNEKIREKMFSLRQTWNDVFQQSKLYTLDVKINSIDPGWPITAQLKSKAPTAIHVNPMFLKANGPEPTIAMQQQLRDKQRELLELQARKLELELLTTKKRIMEQEKQLSIQTESIAKEPSIELAKSLDGVGGHLPILLPTAGGGPIASTLPPMGVMPKTRIAPVPQGMINMVKTRDPRLAKQQAVAAQLGGPASSTVAAGVNNNNAVGSMMIPSSALVPGLVEASIHSAAAGPPKQTSVLPKELIGAKNRRSEVGGVENITRCDSTQDEGSSRNKKPSSSSVSSSSSSHRSRHDHDVKSRKDRKEQSASNSRSSGKGGVAGGVGGKSSSSTRSGSSGSDKRKQRTQSDSLSHDRKSPHSPGKKKTSSEKSSSNHSQNDGSPKGPGKSRSETKGNSETQTSSGKQISQQVRNNNFDSKKHQHSAGDSSASSEGRGVDLRYEGVPQKRIKIEEPVVDSDSVAKEADETVVTMVGQKSSEVQNNSATDDEEALSAMIAKDIDLRAIPLQLIPPKLESEHELTLNGPKAPDAFVLRSVKESPSKRSEDIMEDGDEFSSGKKRSSPINSEEPNAKKSKAEMLDALFGNEDVDLRQLPIGGPLLISGDSQGVENAVDMPRSPLSEKTNSIHGAKGLEKDKLGRPLLYNKLPDDPIERRRSINSLAKPGDIDHRFPPQQNPHHHDAAEDDDNSMDSMNANIKTIIAQAQEQMDKGEITPEQYNILMKQVIQLNETQKIRQAQRIEHVKRQDQMIIRIDDNGSLSGEDDVIVTSVTPAPVPAMRMNEQKDNSSTGVVNDFRGKIHPIDGKPPLVKPFEAAAPFGGIGIPPTSVPPPDIRAQRDPRRLRESKWNRIEPGPGPAWANRPGGGIVGPAVGAPLVVAPSLGGVIRPGMVVPSPWEQAPFPVMAEGISRFPAPPGPQLPLGVLGGVAANGLSMLNPALAKLNDSVRTINIDGIQREIRFYEETAVIFMNWDEPKEIGFQKGARTVIVDDRETFELGFNEPYKSVSIENKVYQMRLGAPTRELYIDDSWYECYFGDQPTTIMLDGKPRVFKIAGPAPQVKIGDSRKDLVAGKINMIVDAKYMIPVFLDCKPQVFEVYGVMHRLQFADFLLTVLIDEQSFPVDYGGLPMLVRSRDRDYYIRFTALPNQVVPGRVYIRDMIRTPLYRDLRTPPKDPSAITPPVPLNPPFAPPTGVPPALPVAGGLSFGAMNKLPPAIGPHHLGAAGANTTSTGLDYLTNLMPSMAMQTAAAAKNGPGYRIEADEKAAAAAAAGGAVGQQAAGSAQQPNSSSSAGGLSLLGNINVEELYKKIVAAGIITKLGGGSSSSPTPPQNAGEGGGASGIEKDTKEEANKSKDKDKPTIPEIDPVLLDKPETIKKRQAAIVHQLFSGMQCSSCGVRFPPEQTMKYSQHLDWHFRQNRRDRDSARKAHSRKWYYDVSDWIQYEEIEDLEEREKNWFETQQSDQGDIKKGGAGGGSGSMGGSGIDGDEMSHDDSPQPSCPAGLDESDRQCHMCHDVFEHFYNEETEEWHLRNAIRVDGSTYHPLCYEDYKASLTMTETTLGNGTLGASMDESQKTDDTMDTSGVSDGKEDEDGADEQEGGKDKSKSSKKGNEMEDDDDDDDDVIVLPAVEPVVQEILDDDGDEQMDEKKETGDMSEETIATAKSPRQPEFQERQIDEDLFIQEPNIEVTDLDTIEDKPPGESVSGNGSQDPNSLSSLLNVKIKEEPKEEDEADEEDALFEEVGTIESSLVEVADRSPSANNAAGEELYEDAIVESIPSPSESSNQMGVVAQPKATIDGNVELQDAQQSATIVPNKIKINITKTKAQQVVTSTGGGHSYGGATNEGETGGDANNGVNVNNCNEDSQGIEDETSNDGGTGGSWEEKEEKNGSEQSNNKETSTLTTTAVAADAAAEVAFEETTNVAYELKDGLQGIELNRVPRVKSGLEASGLCSIM